MAASISGSSTMDAMITNGEEWETPPIVLYRYIPLKRLGQILEGTLYFSSPGSFNDPFDCHLFPTLYGSNSDYRNHYKQILKDRNINRAERRRQLKEVSTVLDQSLFEEAFTAALVGIERRGVLCLSELNCDILMWAHYAEGHSGACVGFDTSFEYFRTVRQVNYRKNYPTENLLPLLAGQGRATERAVTRLVFLTKSEHWSYEKEWRLFQQTSGAYPFPIESLVEINFGCRTSERQMSEMLCKLTSLKKRPRIFRARVSTSEFAIQFEPAM